MILLKIPAKYRSGLYGVYALAGVVLGVCPIIDVTSLWGLSVTKATAALVYVGVAFGLTAAANVGTARVVEVPRNVNDVPDDPA